MTFGAVLRANECRFTLADQSDWDGKRGFYVSLENSTTGTAPCPVSSLRVAVGVADGSQWRFIVSNPTWRTDHDYTVQAVITPSGFRLTLDGVQLGQSGGGFAPRVSNQLTANAIPGWASDSAQYIITQSSLDAVSSEGASASLVAPGTAERPVPLMLLAPGSTPLTAPLPVSATGTLTLTAVFRLSSAADPSSFAPYFDRYGQSIHASFPGKITSDAEIVAAGVDEESRLAAWGIPAGYDAYGGVLDSGWTESGSGFFRVTQRNGVWWLITPAGNPCFYLAVDNAPITYWNRTPVTGRLNLFEWLPPKTPPYDKIWGVNSWGQTDGVEDVSFDSANLIRKYGADWETQSPDSTVRRLKTWGFSGHGKWDGSAGQLPVTPVLGRWDVPSIDRHPDIFDPGVQVQFRASLERQILPRRDDPLIVGWSLGNEMDEIVTGQETRNILAKGTIFPAKHALVDQALATIYNGDVAAMASAWNVKPATVQALYASAPTPPASDVESLRQFYARAYYKWVYETVKSIDPNHLYFGFWIVPGWWENESDWALGAEFVDVIGFDRYAADLADDWLNGLIRATGKPILCGEFSFPAHYDLMRGYRAYPTANAVDDAESGRSYKRWVQQATKHPYVVGLEWFEYRDEPLSGRGPGHGPELVYGEDFAFGLVDVADRPKWDLVALMREANLAAAAGRLNLRPPTVFDGGVVNNASFAGGAPVAPGSIASIFGADLEGAVVRFNGITAPQSHPAFAGQIDAQVPWELGMLASPRADATLSVTANLLDGKSVSVPIAAYAPGIYTAASSGSGQGAVLINGTALLAAPVGSPWRGRPAKRGEWVSIYCNGLGSVTNQPATGAPAPSVALSWTVADVAAAIGGVPAKVAFHGLAPGFVGLYQVNALVPDAAASGSAVTLTLSVAGSASNTVTIAVE